MNKLEYSLEDPIEYVINPIKQKSLIRYHKMICFEKTKLSKRKLYPIDIKNEKWDREMNSYWLREDGWVLSKDGSVLGLLSSNYTVSWLKGEVSRRNIINTIKATMRCAPKTITIHEILDDSDNLYSIFK